MDKVTIFLMLVGVVVFLANAVDVLDDLIHWRWNK